MIAVAALAQTASEKCGCKDSVATCSMLECHFSKPAKERIAQMQSVGMSDDQIVQAFVRDYGAGIYLATPNAFGWIVPYAMAGAGLLVILAILRKYKGPKPMTGLGAVEIDDPALAKYKDRIEKDLANLE